MKNLIYDRQKVYNYAKKWAFLRNPNYYNFDAVGGDCTSFASQCIFSGSNIMNYSKNNGWYYINGYDKSASWSGVEYLYNFLVNNKSVGPYGQEVSLETITIGDIAQLSFDGKKYSHTLVIVNKESKFDLNKIYTASHTLDSFERNISSYNFKKIRFINIEGVRQW